jgi:putative FmdB family regulatory protein
MPTYEYACRKCGHRFEKFQPMKDEPLAKCPKCGRASLKRLVGGGAGLIFKGSGFYSTDYRSKEKAPAPAAAAAPAVSGDSKAGAAAAPAAPAAATAPAKK